jgi:hypothetical protein
MEATSTNSTGGFIPHLESGLHMQAALFKLLPCRVFSFFLILPLYISLFLVVRDITYIADGKPQEC